VAFISAMYFMMLKYNKVQRTVCHDSLHG